MIFWCFRFKLPRKWRFAFAAWQAPLQARLKLLVPAGGRKEGCGAWVCTQARAVATGFPQGYSTLLKYSLCCHFHRKHCVLRKSLGFYSLQSTMRVFKCHKVEIAEPTGTQELHRQQHEAGFPVGAFSCPAQSSVLLAFWRKLTVLTIVVVTFFSLMSTL